MTDKQTSDDIVITYEDFCAWKQMPVTQKILKYLEEVHQQTQERRLDGSYLQDPNGLLRLNFLHGYSTALSEIINIKFEENEDETKSPIL